MIKNNITLIAIGAGVLFSLVALWVFYQALVVVPQERIEAQERQHAEEMRAELLKEASAQADYKNCLQIAYDNYSTNWDNKCEILGEEADCTMAVALTKPIEDWYANEKAACLSVYKSR